MQIELKGGLYSPEINAPAVPHDPECCAVLIHADIGVVGSRSADTFTFTAVTPQFLVKNPELRWGCGYLIVPEFSWDQIERMVSRLVSSISAEDWRAAAAKLSPFMQWEFDGYVD